MSAINIIVNGKTHRVFIPGVITYEELVIMAFGPQANTGRIYTMTWEAGLLHGSLLPGQMVTKQDGLVVSVADTSRA